MARASTDSANLIANILSKIQYPGASENLEQLLYAPQRYHLLNWLFDKLLDGKNPFQQRSLQNLSEEAVLQRLTEKADFLGITSQFGRSNWVGTGQYEERMNVMKHILLLVDAATTPLPPFTSLQDQTIRLFQLTDGVARRQESLLSPEYELFPANLRRLSRVMEGPGASDLESKVVQVRGENEVLHKDVTELALQRQCNFGDDSAEANVRLQAHLTKFLAVATSLKDVYNEELSLAIPKVDVQMVHGLGPLAKTIQEFHCNYSKVVQNMHEIRSSCIHIEADHLAIPTFTSTQYSAEGSKKLEVLSSQYELAAADLSLQQKIVSNTLKSMSVSSSTME